MIIKDIPQKLRFALVGVANTAIDFGLYMLLTTLGLNVIVANYISTTAGLSFSFFANKKYTFRSSGKSLKREIGLFLTVTLFGLWVLQPLVITLAQHLLANFNLDSWVVLLTAKLAATFVTLIWNYLTYSRFVFTSKAH